MAFKFKFFRQFNLEKIKYSIPSSGLMILASGVGEAPSLAFHPALTRPHKLHEPFSTVLLGVSVGLSASLSSFSSLSRINELKNNI